MAINLFYQLFSLSFGHFFISLSLSLSLIVWWQRGEGIGQVIVVAWVGGCNGVSQVVAMDVGCGSRGLSITTRFWGGAMMAQLWVVMPWELWVTWVMSLVVWVVAWLRGGLVMVARWWRGCCGFGVQCGLWVLVGMWCGGRYGGGGVEERNIWQFGFEFWFGYCVLFGFESKAVVVGDGAFGLLSDGGGWLRDRDRE